MTLTDSSEAGSETLICRVLTGSDCKPRPADTPPFVAEPAAPYGGVSWLPGDPADYDRDYCVDLVQLSAFLHATQPEGAEALDLDHDSPIRRKFDLVPKLQLGNTTFLEERRKRIAQVIRSGFEKLKVES